jgi:hypothetical protein
MLWLIGGLLVEVIWLVGLAKLCIDFGSEETTVKPNLSEINTTILCFRFCVQKFKSGVHLYFPPSFLGLFDFKTAVTQSVLKC